MKNFNPLCLLDYSLKELVSLAASLGHSEGRARNLYSAINKGAFSSPLQLKNVSRRFTQTLDKMGYYCSPLRLFQTSVSIKDTGTVKLLFSTRDGLPVESVLMPAPDNRSTLCLSSQVGCAMGCQFCNTAKMGLKRNLTSGEILSQFHQATSYARKHRLPEVTNIVFMGMGEPFDNFDNVMKAFHTLNHPLSTKISRNRITISTSGHVDGLKKLAQLNMRINIAISLNATDNKTRSELMPINRKWPIETLIQSLREFPLRPGRVIVIEYVLIKGVNDSPEDARRLTELLDGLSCKVNLIRYNETPLMPYTSPSEDTVQRFAESIKHIGKGVLLRQSLGADIDGACGQLGTKQLG